MSGKKRKLLTVDEVLEAPPDPAPNAIGWSADLSKRLGQVMFFYEVAMEIDKHVRLIDYAMTTLLSGDMEEAGEAFRFCGLLEPKNDEERKRLKSYLHPDFKEPGK